MTIPMARKFNESVEIRWISLDINLERTNDINVTLNTSRSENERYLDRLIHNCALAIRFRVL